MKDDLVTVVVPIYNVEKYVEKCLNSIINQTYKNIEIIIVNDGSEDESANICERMRLRDNRIKIINQKNAGLSAARNTGIQHALGKYICFVDSDDFVHENYIKILLETLIKTGSDISVCDFYYIDENEKTWFNKTKKEKIYSNVEGIIDFLNGMQNTEVMTWNKLYKLSLFKDNNIFFPEGKIHEDNFTTYKLYYYSKKISMVEDRLYYYLQRNNSIMGKKFNIKRLDILQAIEETKRFLKDMNLEKEIECYEAITNVNILNNMIRSNFLGEEKKYIINKIKCNKKRYMINKHISIKMKILISMLIGDGWLYCKIVLLREKILEDKVRKK